MRIHLIVCLLLMPFFSIGQNYDFLPLNAETNASFRGMSVVSEQVVWVSGNAGTIGRSLDAGKTWEWIKPAGYEQLDFRDIEAFSAEKAIVVNAGSPAYILLTEDGGKTWKETYKNVDSAIFLDGMDFWDNNRGIVFGDPINSKMQLLRSLDGGRSWTDISATMQAKLGLGEASFAASGTTICALGEGKVWIATGGTVSNIYYSSNYGSTWQIAACPILQGQNSTGPFSIAFLNERTGVVVGGDYTRDKENENNVLLSNDAGQTWSKPSKPVAGFRSGVIYVNDRVLLATGTSGTDVSNDGGKVWHHISDLSFNVIKKSKQGSLILLAGNKGQIYQLRI
ncbi:WD40/YVTN/BNR-like repeat-containing protein [Pedobacter sp. GR22-6]|uniref:WD40/YVTN/BNR-like repeat-containing protein n=1 Tax=Pedobacter sp. GR22-6 TaxID=3127957 RepID=UPI00307E9B80